VIYDATTAAELAADFLTDQAACVEFSLVEYEARPVHLRARDSLARLLSSLL